MTSLYKVERSTLNKSLRVPTSKSYANRILILAAISKKPTRVTNIPKSTDVTTMIRLLRELGLKIVINESELIIKNSFPECEGDNELTLLSGDGGTTNRFLIPLLARGQNRYKIEAEGHMRKRPMGPLLKGLKELGVEITENIDCWISVKGPLTNEARRIEVNSSESTQFVTGLSLAVSDREIDIVPVKLEASKAYYEMTNFLIKEFKAQKVDWEIPVDFSGLSYPLALAALSGEVEVTNCKMIDRFQADSIFIEVLEEMGIEIRINDNGLHLEKVQHLMPFEIDGSKCPDLVPTLVFMASYACGASHIKNIEVLRHKESDRVDEVLKLLVQFKIEHEFDASKHDLIIYGDPLARRNSIVDYMPPPDHRIVMVAYLYMRFNGGGNLGNSQHVNKSYPDFFEQLK